MGVYGNGRDVQENRWFCVMDDNNKNFILVIGFSFVVFLVWMYFFLLVEFLVIEDFNVIMVM